MSRIARHTVLLAASVVTGLLFYLALHRQGLLWCLSMASAYGSLALLAISLMIGPWNKLRGRPNPVSGHLRRDIGIWAGVLGLFHVIVGLQVHFKGNMWLYFLPPADAAYAFPLRIDAFGLTNYAGLGATCVLVLLLAISNDASLRSLGPKRWKSLQRWNYIGAFLVVAHGVVYQVLEERTTGFVVAYAAIVLVTMAIQILGYRANKAKG